MREPRAFTEALEAIRGGCKTCGKAEKQLRKIFALNGTPKRHYRRRRKKVVKNEE